MVAGKDDSHPSHLVQPRSCYKYNALRVGALYGANAHGKTKLVEAMSFAKRLIVNGRKAGQAIRTHRASVFWLAPELQSKPSRFEFVIMFTTA